MSNPRASLATGDLSIEAGLVVHRPQCQAEWCTWYATQRAARYALQQRGADHLAADYGLDPDTIAATVRRWGGPALPDGLFWAWFGVPSGRPAAAAPPAEDDPEPVASRGRDAAPGDLDIVLVERAIGGDQGAAHLLTHEERQAVAGLMFAAGRSMTAICKMLHVNGGEAAKLIGAHRRRTEMQAGAA